MEIDPLRDPADAEPMELEKPARDREQTGQPPRPSAPLSGPRAWWR